MDTPTPRPTPQPAPPTASPDGVLRLPARDGRDGRAARPGLLFAVYAPLGSDAVLSWYPDGQPKPIEAHPMVRHLEAVAREGAHVRALIDLHDDATWLVTIPAFHESAPEFLRLGRLDLADPVTLGEFLARAAHHFPRCATVLSLEGHGAGFLPALDPHGLVFDAITGGGRFAWTLGDDRLLPTVAETGKPVVEAGAPVLPIVAPTIGSNQVALSTWAIGEGLRQAEAMGAPPVSVLHLDNCFNFCVELLHTLAPHAQVATGYCNYNFFTAGEAYPAVFARLTAAGQATPLELGRWFAEENHRVLAESGHEPTVGCTIALSRMKEITERVDELSDALLDALRGASPADRPALLDGIQAAITRSQQYDSRPDFVLETPDELTDLDSFASALLSLVPPVPHVLSAADSLRGALAGIKVYGDTGSPWMAPDQVWDFSACNLAMNIFLPDPLRRGLWDWRSTYYLDVNPDPTKPHLQTHVIDFVTATDWVDFLVEYHRETVFTGLLPAEIPVFPVRSVRGKGQGIVPVTRRMRRAR